MASGKNKKKTGNVTESTPKLLLSNKKTLKPEPKIVKKSSNPNSAQMKEAKITLQVQARNEDEKKTLKGVEQEINNSERDGGRNMNSPHGKEKEIINEKCKGTSKRDQKDEEDLGGLIFMCNAKTKPDCFHYHIMGVPTNKQELVMGIKPGLTLFLYDFNLKIMYGIYKASSSGGMKLEPAAFGGAFPVQVRFKVHKDCLPLPERVFKKAIKENYDEKTRKFKTELTVQQVKKLTELFHPAPLLCSNAQSSVQEPLLAPIIWLPPPATVPGQEVRREQFYKDHHSSSEAAQNLMPSDHERKQLSKNPISSKDLSSPNPLFLTEKEYRSYGLRQERHILTTPVSPTLDPYSTDQEREQLLMNHASINGDAALVRNESIRSDPFFLSEKDYRAYGLKVQRELPASMTPTIETTTTAFDKYPRDPYDPYDYDTASLVDRYLSMPSMVAAPSESYSLTARESYINNSNHMESNTKNYSERVVPDEQRLYSTYGSNVQSDYNLKYHQLGGEPEFTYAPVSSQYSFGGPSVSYR
uniref:DCD domain-containing protein n=1 Tax=Davidia involucrata TaxID=16924 RepID=A0A5B6ZHN0_DAVIN